MAGGAGGIGGLSVRGVERAVDRQQVLRGVDLDVAPGECLAVLGPSGCGKTTLLRAICGLDPIDAGEVRLDDRILSGPGVHVEPDRRGIGLVFQDGALFPHLDVARNVGFGLARAERRSSPRIDELLGMVGLGGLGERMPDELSGGEAQRVALARALAPRPRVLLLDEPFSNLDAPLRARLRAELGGLLRATGTTAVFVTHDRGEAFELADHLALMRDGRIVAVDEPERAYRYPVDAWAASLVGDVNLLEATVVDGGSRVRCVLGEVALAAPPSGRLVVVRPEDLCLVPPEAGPGASGTVLAERFTPPVRTTTVRLDAGGTVEVTSLAGEPPRDVGTAVTIRWSVDAAVVVDRPGSSPGDAPTR